MCSSHACALGAAWKHPTSPLLWRLTPGSILNLGFQALKMHGRCGICCSWSIVLCGLHNLVHTPGCHGYLRWEFIYSGSSALHQGHRLHDSLLTAWFLLQVDVLVSVRPFYG